MTTFKDEAEWFWKYGLKYSIWCVKLTLVEISIYFCHLHQISTLIIAPFSACTFTGLIWLSLLYVLTRNALVVMHMVPMSHNQSISPAFAPLTKVQNYCSGALIFTTLGIRIQVLSAGIRKWVLSACWHQRTALVKIGYSCSLTLVWMLSASC